MECCCGKAAGPTAGFTGTGEWGDQSGVDCQLSPTPKGQAVCDDFDAPIIDVLDMLDVEVCQSGVGGNPRAGFAAHSGGCAFKWASTATKYLLTGHRLRGGRLGSRKCDGTGRFVQTVEGAVEIDGGEGSGKGGMGMRSRKGLDPPIFCLINNVGQFLDQWKTASSLTLQLAWDKGVFSAHVCLVRSLNGHWPNGGDNLMESAAIIPKTERFVTGFAFC